MLYSRSRFSCEPSEIGAAKPDGARLLREAPAAFGRLCVETPAPLRLEGVSCPAAFGRLCVETRVGAFTGVSRAQPPSGGCVLKLNRSAYNTRLKIQPPSGGCVLKLILSTVVLLHGSQPPSGGCVLKLDEPKDGKVPPVPAAFGRLCVETRPPALRAGHLHPAAFGRLCVETVRQKLQLLQQPASRLRAAVC